jgi:molybdopterin converting factor small subunit
MMKVTMNYFGQLRNAAGAESEEVELDAGATVQDAVSSRIDAHGDVFRTVLLGEDGVLRPSVMVLVNDAPAAKTPPATLNDGDRVKLLAAIAGG